ncbi:MAG TPA: ANTAR domain-containing protein, partial [Anaerolineae bacterium]|nr:ANTAR domain-containing protein [Anaerolineae bacterium]
MSCYGLTEREAFMRIHRRSGDSRRPMREVAEEILREVA